MANARLSGDCAFCGKPLDGRGILVAEVKFTHRPAQGSCYPGRGEIRPNFYNGGARSGYHAECFQEMLDAAEEAGR